MSRTPGDVGSDISDARWRRLEALLVTAMDLPNAARDELIARECDGDSVMAAELRALLAAHDRAGMLDRPLSRWSGVATSVRARSHLAWTLAELGDFPAARNLATEAMRLADASNHPYSLCHACLGLGVTRVR